MLVNPCDPRVIIGIEGATRVARSSRPGRQVQRGIEGQTGFLSNLIIEIFSHHK